MYPLKQSLNRSCHAGIATYRYYIDGEANASIVFTPRMAVGIGFPPAGTSGPGGGGAGLDTRADEYIIGGKGETCDEACGSVQRECNPVMIPPNVTDSLVGDFMSRLVRFDTGAGCNVDADAWFAPDQPSYVWARNNSNFGKCLGTTGMPAVGFCNGSHPLVQRLCRCSPGQFRVTSTLTEPWETVGDPECCCQFPPPCA